jgi:hypothetical protein
MLLNRLKTFFKKISILRYDPKFRRARYWTNLELENLAKYFSGDIINVSGWADEDKFGKTYEEYFVNKKSYTISNWKGGPQKGKNIEIYNSIEIDLEKPIQEKYIQAFDCVLCHTVFEHLFDIFQATENLCRMSRDVICLIVPFVQCVHACHDYSDYWRFTPYGIEKLFNSKGFEVIYRNGVDIPGTSIYYLYVFSKYPKRYIFLGKPKELSALPMGNDIYMKNRLKRYLKYLLS